MTSSAATVAAPGLPRSRLDLVPDLPLVIVALFRLTEHGLQS
jgi:hypothetical protein